MHSVFQRLKHLAQLAAVVAVIPSAQGVSAQDVSRGGFRSNENQTLFVKGMVGTTFTQLSDTSNAFNQIQGTRSVRWSC